ncbi:MAG: phospholipase [Proteobacteria bacterium]|nr:MAG: phospholipase [Pseudomonadota bacterium]
MISLTLALLLSFSAQAKFTVPGFELVVTLPVDAGLDAGNVREPIAVWKELIKGAKSRLDFGQMYASGEAGEPLGDILDQLAAAGKRGVKIRFMLEEKMLHASDAPTLKRLRSIPNLELRILNYAKVSADGIVHAKYIVADGRQAFVGSQNFDWRSLKHIHETGLLVSEPKIVGQLQAIFNGDWKAYEILQRGTTVPRRLDLEPKAVEHAEGSAYLVASPQTFLPPNVGSSEAELPKLIGSAKSEIRIQLLDYSPLRRDGSYYPVIDSALRAAYARGVKVKLLVSHWNLGAPEVNHLKSLAALPGFEVRYAHIPPARGGPVAYGRVNHSKFMTIDGKLSWVGTSNWAGGYLDKSRNLEIVVPSLALTARLNEFHAQLWDAPYTAKIDLNAEYPEPVKDGR